MGLTLSPLSFGANILNSATYAQTAFTTTSSLSQAIAAGVGPISFPNHVTAGNLLVVVGASESTVDPLTVTDTLGTTYAKALAYTANSNHIAVYYGIAPSSGANTVNLSGLASSFSDVAVCEFTVTGTVSVESTASAYNSTSPSTCSISITAATLIFAVQRSFHTTTFTANPPSFLIGQQNTASDGMATAYQTTSGAGSYTVSITMTGSADNAPLVLVAFKNVALPVSATIVTSAGISHAGKGRLLAPFGVTVAPASGGGSNYGYTA